MTFASPARRRACGSPRTACRRSSPAAFSVPGSPVRGPGRAVPSRLISATVLGISGTSGTRQSCQATYRPVNQSIDLSTNRPARALVPEGAHRVVMRMRSAPAAPGQRKRVHHRPGPQLAVQLVKTPQNRLAMGHRGRRISPARRRLPRHRVRRTRRSPAAGRRRHRTSFPGGPGSSS